MSNHQRRQRGAFGPGQTVLASPGDDVAQGPPPTVRDPDTAFAQGYAPPLPPPYGAVEAHPVGIPPPPARGRRARRRGGPSLLAIGVVSFFVIGGLATTLAVLKYPSDDEDQPTPTAAVPAPATVPADPGTMPPDPPAPPPPSPTTRRPLPQRAAPPSRPPARIGPGGRPGNPQQPPRYPPQAPRRPPTR